MEPFCDVNVFRDFQSKNITNLYSNLIINHPVKEKNL